MFQNVLSSPSTTIHLKKKTSTPPFLFWTHSLIQAMDLMLSKGICLKEESVLPEHLHNKGQSGRRETLKKGETSQVRWTNEVYRDGRPQITLPVETSTKCRSLLSVAVATVWTLPIETASVVQPLNLLVSATSYLNKYSAPSND